MNFAIPKLAASIDPVENKYIEDVVNLLLEKGADKDHVGSAGLSPLCQLQSAIVQAGQNVEPVTRMFYKKLKSMNAKKIGCE